MRSHVIRWIESSASPDWDSIPSLEVDLFPWYVEGERQGTQARLAVTSESLWLRFDCEDAHIFAQVTQANGPVCEDSCVEFFFTPDPEKCLAYFNLEINCCGTILLGYGEGRHGRVSAPAEVIEAIQVQTSVAGATKEESPDDDGWMIEAKVPLSALWKMADFPEPRAGSFWRGNLFRCGGKTDPQYACWSPIEWPHPDYHRPEFFGTLEIEKT